MWKLLFMPKMILAGLRWGCNSLKFDEKQLTGYAIQKDTNKRSRKCFA
jgi:hypothetical protein